MAYILKDEKGESVKHDGSEVFATDIAGCVKGVNKDERTLVIVGSDESKDRDGDIIMVAGWDLTNFLKNPVFLYAHEHSGVPIGSATKVVRRKNPARLEFHEKFPSEGVYPFADMILSLFQEKVLNATSVGFIPRKWEELPKDEEDGDRWFPGRRFVRQELLELSAVAVPSNPNALLVNSVAKSIMSKSMDEIKEMMSPKDRDLILEQLAVKEIEFEDETKAFQIQVTETITNEEDSENKMDSTSEEFLTIKGEFENSDKQVETTIENTETEDEMEIKELLDEIMSKLDILEDSQESLFEDITYIKSFITNLTKSEESDTSENEEDDKSESKDETDDLYKEALSPEDNKEIQEEKADGLSDEEQEIIKQVIANLKETIK